VGLNTIYMSLGLLVVLAVERFQVPRSTTTFQKAVTTIYILNQLLIIALLNSVLTSASAAMVKYGIEELEDPTHIGTYGVLDTGKVGRFRCTPLDGSGYYTGNAAPHTPLTWGQEYCSNQRLSSAEGSYKSFSSNTSSSNQRKTITSSNGITFQVKYNEHGAVLNSTNNSENLTLYLGRSCDAYSKRFGEGSWSWANGGTVVDFSSKNFGFPRQGILNIQKCRM